MCQIDALYSTAERGPLRRSAAGQSERLAPNEGVTSTTMAATFDVTIAVSAALCRCHCASIRSTRTSRSSAWSDTTMTCDQKKDWGAKQEHKVVNAGPAVQFGTDGPGALFLVTYQASLAANRTGNGAEFR